MEHQVKESRELYLDFGVVTINAATCSDPSSLVSELFGSEEFVQKEVRTKDGTRERKREQQYLAVGG